MNYMIISLIYPRLSLRIRIGTDSAETRDTRRSARIWSLKAQSKM